MLIKIMHVTIYKMDFLQKMNYMHKILVILACTVLQYSGKMMIVVGFCIYCG